MPEGTGKANPDNPKPSPTRDEHFDRIEATPEKLARVFLRTPPKRSRKKWEYMKDTLSDD